MATKRIFLIDFRIYKEHTMIAKQMNAGCIDPKILYIEKVVNDIDIISGTWLTVAEAKELKEKGIDVICRAARDEDQTCDLSLLTSL